MEVFSAFVTGANRGIGLELVRQLVHLPKPPAFVFATYRSIDAIQALTNIRDSTKKTHVLLIKMDVTRKNEIDSAREITESVVGDRGLTLLINNAGVYAEQKFPHVTEENLLYHFKSNTIGPTMIVQAFLPLLQKAASLKSQQWGLKVRRSAVFNISSILGSNTRMYDYTDAAALNCPSHNICKASLNMMMRIVAAEVKDKGILVVSMCPGWVKTGMSTDKAHLEVHESVSAMLSTLETLNHTHHGSFMDRHGNPYEF